MTAITLETRTGILAVSGQQAAIWFPVPPGVTSLPAAPAITTNPTPQPPNAVAVPANFDPGNLQKLFGTILPYGVAAVWPKQLTATYVVAPFNEEIPVDAATTTSLTVGAFPYALVVPGSAVTAVTTTKLEVVALFLVGIESVPLGTKTGLDVQTWLQIGIHDIQLRTTTQLGITWYAVGLLDFTTSVAVVPSTEVVLMVNTTIVPVRSTEVMLATVTANGASDETYYNSWSWQNYLWDSEVGEGWAN